MQFLAQALNISISYLNIWFPSAVCWWKLDPVQHNHTPSLLKWPKLADTHLISFLNFAPVCVS